jgi:ArsR family transcriptional regulator, arsenate/arsenite/antimonite-responsive transcriptional repressor
MNKERKTYNMELFFKALADRTRLRLINLIGDDEVCVCFFVEVLTTHQPKISRHLAYLRRAGLVGARREGKWMHYKIVDPPDSHAQSIFKEVRRWLAQDKEMQKDRERLIKVCCAPNPPIQIQGAPRPISLQSSLYNHN